LHRRSRRKAVTFDTAFALASHVPHRTGDIKWYLGVAGALAAAAAIDLITGFSLTVPEDVIAEVKAVSSSTVMVSPSATPTARPSIDAAATGKRNSAQQSSQTAKGMH
jgi:hypothetical protein